MVHLLDVNVLIALAWPNHVHHAAAHSWFAANAAEGWATCPLTQCGFVRVSANRTVIAAAVPIQDAVDVLRQMVSDPRRVFWADDVAFTDGQYVAHRAIQGHRQVTDAYLVGLSRRHGGALATLDAALVASLPADARRAVAVIPA